MPNSIRYCGTTYDETTDWRSLIEHPSYGLERDLDLQSAFGALAEALRGTPMATGLADAALEVIERGTDEAVMDGVAAAGWEDAPGAFDRILGVLARRPRKLPEKWVERLYGALFRLDPAEPRLLASFAADVVRGGGHRMLEHAARYNAEWLATQLSALCPPLDCDMARWLFVAGVPTAGAARARPTLQPEAARARLLDAIAQLGEPYVNALVQQVRELARKHTNSQAHLVTEKALKRHPVFAARLP